MLPRPRASLLEIDVYVPGKSTASYDGEIFKLSSNETPFGPSPRAIEAAHQALGRAHLYPEGTSRLLREAIGRTYGLDPAHIVCGNGSDDLLTLLAHAYLEPGDEGVFTEHGFLVYRIAILAAGATPVVAKEVHETTNVDEILACITPRTKIVFIANPNNPTGTYLPFEEVKRLQGSLPPHVLLVLDAAYAEYVRRNDYAAGLELVSTCQNVVMTRTFSKVYGLAGLRVGWCYAPQKICEVIHTIRGPFNVNQIAMEAAIAALDDQDHIARAVDHNEKWISLLMSGLSAIGLYVTPSVANFLLVHFPPSGGKNAQMAFEYLSQHGLIVRAVDAYGFPHALRLTVGNEKANMHLLHVLTQFMRQEG